VKKWWVVILILAVGVLYYGCFRDRDHWTRKNPLQGVTVIVRDGHVELPDGRSLVPAGVLRASGVSEMEYEQALKAACAQGVVVVRDVGDGSAFLRVEPKFYNWCGTRNRDGSRWAGSYIQMPLSEFLIQSGYATPNVAREGLTPRERWRLEGMASEEVYLSPWNKPTQLITERAAFRYDGNESALTDEEFLEYMISQWKEPPAE
jgi:hypothetical protein